MTNSTNVFFVLPEPIFNKEACQAFPDFSKKDSSFLYVTQLHNLYEIFFSIFPKENLFICLNEKDKESFSNDTTLTLPSENIFYFDENMFPAQCSSIFEKRNQAAKNFIFVRPDFVGLTTSDILQTLDLFLLEDDVLVLMQSTHKKNVFFACNKFRAEIPALLYKKNYHGDSALKKLCGLEYQFYNLKNVFSLVHATDFKELYQLLSRKENYSYCSQPMHNRFTHLFIEYKELI